MKQKKIITMFLCAVGLIVSHCADVDFDRKFNNPVGGDNGGGGQPPAGSHFNPNITYGSFVDSRDNKRYFTVTIGTQVWMAENLNYATSSGSWCYLNQPPNCNTYGRLYDWNTARTVCPNGWHLPSAAEWDVLVNFAGGEETAGTKLKSQTGWEDDWWTPNTNDFGFSALPGGRHPPDDMGGWIVGYTGVWWTATEVTEYNDVGDVAWVRYMDNSYEYVYSRDFTDKSQGLSVRCVRD